MAQAVSLDRYDEAISQLAPTLKNSMFAKMSDAQNLINQINLQNSADSVRMINGSALEMGTVNGTVANAGLNTAGGAFGGMSTAGSGSFGLGGIFALADGFQDDGLGFDSLGFMQPPSLGAEFGMAQDMGMGMMGDPGAMLDTAYAAGQNIFEFAMDGGGDISELELGNFSPTSIAGVGGADLGRFA